jgi:hypothetical protein
MMSVRRGPVGADARVRPGFGCAEAMSNSLVGSDIRPTRILGVQICGGWHREVDRRQWCDV